jgi:hypothetical protein
VMSVVLLLTLMQGRSLFRSLGVVAGLVCFGLSLVRSAWLGWLGGMAVLMGGRGLRRGRGRWLLVVVAVIAVALTVGPGGAIVNERVSTLAHPGNDSSLQGRIALYSSWGSAVADPVGHGLGAVGLAAKLGGNTLGVSFDAGVLEFPFVLGWAGTLLYVGGFVRLWRSASRGRASNGAVYRAVLAAGFIELFASNSFTGVSGVMLWLCLGLWVAESNRHPVDGAAAPALTHEARGA